MASQSYPMHWTSHLLKCEQIILGRNLSLESALELLPVSKQVQHGIAFPTRQLSGAMSGCDH